MIVKKDPSATLDYAFDWSDWLATDETISSYTITAQSVITLETVAPYAQPANFVSGAITDTTYVRGLLGCG